MPAEITQPTDQAVGSEENSGTIQIPQDQVHPSLSNSPHPSMAQVHQIKVSGETREVTTAQLIEMAQKGTAASEKFEEAATTRKENATAIAVYEDLQTFFEEGDVDAFQRIGAQMGVPADQVAKVAADTFGTGSDSGDGNTEEDDRHVVDDYDREIQGRDTRSRDQNQGPIDYSRLAPDVQRALRIVEQQRMEKIVQSALDSDEAISYNMGRHSPEGQSAIRKYVDEKIRGRLASFQGDFGDGTRILAEVLPEVRDHLQALGSPRSLGPMGLGPSPGGGDSEVYPTQKPDHVPSTEGDAFDQHILETMGHYQAQAERGRS